MLLLSGVRAKQDDDPEGRQLLGLGLGLNPQIGLLGLSGLGGLGGLGLGGLGGTTRLALMMRLQQIQRLQLLQSLIGNNRRPSSTPGMTLTPNCKLVNFYDICRSRAWKQ